MAPPTLPPDLVSALTGVRSVGVVTGAGISAESGIPTYRGVGGLYDDPGEGERMVEALSGPTLRRDPDRTWRAVAALARASLEARPNAAHRALVRIEDAVERFSLLTQNVDGLHERAGSRDVIAIHGDVLATRCLSCGAGERLGREAVAALEATPRCVACGGSLRPGAVLFGEPLPTAELARLHDSFLLDPPDLVLVVGTSALFPYVAEPVFAAARAGRSTVEVNPGPSEVSQAVGWHLRGPAGIYVPLLADLLAPASGGARP